MIGQHAQLAGAPVRHRLIFVAATTVAALLMMNLAFAPPARAQVGVPVTYADHVYGSTVNKPSADKPQSKLWYHDGAWWAIMVSAGGETVFVHELMSDHTWRNTGTLVDDRVNGTGDALWSAADGKLYVATRANGSNTRVTRMSYNPVARLYTVDPGFPVTVDTGGGSESVTIDQDSLGRLWLTYTRASRLWVAHSDPGGINWTAGFQPDVPDVVIKSDDISALITFSGSVGVLWSDQQSGAFRFAIHDDADPDTVWRVEDALAGTGLADDHINLKQLSGDAQGRIFAAIKTSAGDAAGADPNATLVGVLVRTPDAEGVGTWTLVPAGTVADDHTRPIIMIDQENEELYFFATAPVTSGDIFYKKTSLADPSFGPGRGQPFVDYTKVVNNASGAKDPVTSMTGLVVLATAEGQSRYVHAEMALAGPPDTTPPSVPADLVAAAAGPGQVALTWSASTDDVGVTGYTVRRDGDVTATVTGTTYTDDTVAPGTTYSYTVEAVDAAANSSGESAPATVTTSTAVPIALRAATTATNGNGGTTLTMTVPASQQGDLLLATVDVRGAPTLTAPAGWTLVRQDTSGTAMRLATFSRVADAAEPGSYTWGISSTRVAVGSMLAYSGVSGTVPVEASSGQVNARSKSITAPSVTSVSPNAVVVGLFGTSRGATVTPPTGMTERSDVRSPVSASSQITGETADAVQVAAGASGPRVATATLAGANIGQLVALKPAG